MPQKFRLALIWAQSPEDAAPGFFVTTDSGEIATGLPGAG
jgi:hypothetical protein